MLKLLGRTAWKHPRIILLLFLGATILFAANMPSAEIDASIKSLLPDDMEARTNMDKIEAIFGGTEMVLVAIDGGEPQGILDPEHLGRLESISLGLEMLPGVDKVLSLATANDIRGDDGFLTVEKFFAYGIPQTEEEIGDFRLRVEENEIYSGSLVSDDWSAAAAIAFLEEDADDEELLSELALLLEENPGKATVHLGGLPIDRAEAAIRMRGDMMKFIPIGLLIMLVFLFISFRDWRGMVLPFLMVVQSIIVGMGFGVAMGWQIQMLTVLLPVMLIAVANDYGIHLFAMYQELSRSWRRENPHREPSRQEKGSLIEKLVASLGGPVLWAGVTTILGFLALSSHIVTSARRLGFQAGLGITFALIGSLLFMPAMLALLPLPKMKRGAGNGYLPGERLLGRTAGIIIKYPGRIIAASAGLALVFSLGSFFLVADTNPVNFFPPSSKVYRADRFIQEKFGGSTTLNLVVQGDIKDPEILREMERVEAAMDARPNITETSAITSVVRQMNRVLHDDDPAYDTIPDSREAVAQYFLLYAFSGDPEDFEKMVDFDYTNGLITARIAEPSSEVIDGEVDFIEAWLDEHPEAPFGILCGFAVLLRDLTAVLVKGQIISLAVSLLGMFIVLSFVFRSVRTGALAVLPLIIAAGSLFGLMGWTGIELSTVTTMLTSIILGVGIDYTIHFLWHFRAAMKSGSSSDEAVRDTLTTVGRGILFNALSVVIGFLVLLISGFLPVRFFGFLIVLSISLCLLGALVLLPAIYLFFKQGEKACKKQLSA